jgi:hypothetical protein
MAHDLCRLLLGFTVRVAGQGAVHVQDIGVGSVTDFFAALPAHGHHQHRGLQGPCRRHNVLGHAQRAEDSGAVSVGEGLTHLVLGEQSGAVRDGDAQDLAPPDQPDQPHGAFRLGVAGHLGHDFLPLRLETQRSEVLV